MNSQQAMLFAFLYMSPTWARAVELDGEAYCFVSKGKIIDELPLLTDKPDTVYRLLRQLQDLGVIKLAKQGQQTLVAITQKGALWNDSRAPDDVPELRKNTSLVSDKNLSNSEKNPTFTGEKSDQNSEINPRKLGKKSDITSEKNPTYHITNNHITKSSKTSSVHGYPDWFESLWKIYPPRVGANDKRKAFRAAGARLKNGKSVDQLFAALGRYRNFLQASGRWGSEFVMQAATFFGPGGHVDNPWVYSSPQPPRGAAGETRGRSLADDLTDRSWALPCGSAGGPEPSGGHPGLEYHR